MLLAVTEVSGIIIMQQIPVKVAVKVKFVLSLAQLSPCFVYPFHESHVRLNKFVKKYFYFLPGLRCDEMTTLWQNDWVISGFYFHQFAVRLICKTTLSERCQGNILTKYHFRMSDHYFQIICITLIKFCNWCLKKIISAIKWQCHQ